MFLLKLLKLLPTAESSNVQIFSNKRKKEKSAVQHELYLHFRWNNHNFTMTKVNTNQHIKIKKIHKNENTQP